MTAHHKELSGAPRVTRLGCERVEDHFVILEAEALSADPSIIRAGRRDVSSPFPRRLRRPFHRSDCWTLQLHIGAAHEMISDSPILFMSSVGHVVWGDFDLGVIQRFPHKAQRGLSHVRLSEFVVLLPRKTEVSLAPSHGRQALESPTKDRRAAAPKSG